MIAGPGGSREIPVEAITLSPGKTSLAPGEFVAELRLPARPQGGGDAYLRSIPRTEMDIAVVGAGAALVIDASGTCTAARIALGAVAPTVLLVEAAGKALVGSKLDDAALEATWTKVSAHPGVVVDVAPGPMRPGSATRRALAISWSPWR